MADRELLLEIGCEELPAAWLPALTRQIGERVAARLAEVRLQASSPVETYSTPRRLAVRIARLADRQTDFEETLTGPPVSAAFAADGAPMPAALGFARKHRVDVSDLVRAETPKGVYLTYRHQHRGRPAPDVLPGVLGGVLRDLTFPKQMRWDAQLDDGRGELLFGRPIRWLLFLYGARVVPFTIGRGPLAIGPQVQEVASAAVTYGHRFLATTGRPGRSVKVRSFEEYQSRLAEHFVVLDRDERRTRIVRDLDAQARRLGGRVLSGGPSGLLEEVPDLVEYPSVVAGMFAPEFLEIPAEVLTTTMIHHQHYFPIVDEAGRLKPAFLAITNAHPPDPRAIARNAERVLTARLRDAQFFWRADRRVPLEARLDRLDTLLFHQKIGSYRARAERIERLAEWIARDPFGRPDQAEAARLAGRLAKVDLTTEMVREFTELQGTMGGIYAREEGQPEAVWKAIYHQYLPIGVEADAPPRARDLGEAAVPWAAVALADKIDTLVSLFQAGERPTGSRDPFGLRRQGQGALRILVDLPELTGLAERPAVEAFMAKADTLIGTNERAAEWDLQLRFFLLDRLTYLFEQRGVDIRNIRAVVKGDPFSGVRPLDVRRKLEVLPEFTETPEFQQLATAFKRVRNIAREVDAVQFDFAERTGAPLELPEPAEQALLEEIERRRPVIERAVETGRGYREAFAEAAGFGPAVDRFFTDVFVMVDDQGLRQARLRLMKRLEQLILKLADISEIVAQ